MDGGTCMMMYTRSNNVPAGEGFTDVMHFMPLNVYMSVQLGSDDLPQGPSRLMERQCMISF